MSWKTLVFAAAISIVLASPVNAISVKVEPACGGIGFEGTAIDGETVVKFKSCASGKLFCYVRVWSGAGDPMSEQLSDGTHLRIWMGGVEIGENMTDEQEKKVQAALFKVQAEFDTMRCLYSVSPEIPELQLERYKDARFCFLLHGQGYEGEPEKTCSSLVREEQAAPETRR